MSETTLGKLIRFHSKAVLDARNALAGVANEVDRRTSEIAEDRFLTPSEKRRERGRLISEADQKIPALVQAARDAHEEASRFITAELRKIEPSDVARTRVRRLLDRETPPNGILAQAIELGDQDTLAALRDDLSWGLGPSSDAFMRHLEHSIARLTRGEGEGFAKLLELRDTPAIDEARRLAVASTSGQFGSAARARISYGHATGQTGDGAAAAGGDDE